MAVGQSLRLRGTERAVGMRVQSHDRHLDRDRRLRHLLDTTAQHVLRRNQQITVPLLGCCRPGIDTLASVLLDEHAVVCEQLEERFKFRLPVGQAKLPRDLSTTRVRPAVQGR